MIAIAPLLGHSGPAFIVAFPAVLIINLREGLVKKKYTEDCYFYGKGSLNLD
jgi:hypothetical protein